jgi:hypothetical protein
VSRQRTSGLAAEVLAASPPPRPPPPRGMSYVGCTASGGRTEGLSGLRSYRTSFLLHKSPLQLQCEEEKNTILRDLIQKRKTFSVFFKDKIELKNILFYINVGC